MGHGCVARYGTSRRGFLEHAQRVGVVAGVMLAIFVVSGFSMIWPLIVVAVSGMKLGAHARRVYWSDAADSADEDREPEPEFTIV